MTEPTALAIVLEGGLWQPHRTWNAAVDHLAGRFARVRPLPDGLGLADGDAGDLPDLSARVRQLDAWAGADLDWARELQRFLDEHLPMYVRPDRARNQRVRALAAQQPLGAWSALPTGPMESVLRHLGVLRSFTALHERQAQPPPDVVAP